MFHRFLPVQASQDLLHGSAYASSPLATALDWPTRPRMIPSTTTLETMGPAYVRPLSRWAAPAILVSATVIMARILQQGGHGWGDDFALYINQARGLVEGTATQVIVDNRFAVDNSAFRDFTPVAYPWVTSLALMPIIAVFGIDYGLLKLVPTFALAISILLIWIIARRRLGQISAVVVTAVVAINPWYLWATDAVLSDLLFLAATLGVIAVADRCVSNASILGATARCPVALGVMISLAAHIRREGLGLLAVLALIQAAAWWRSRPEHLSAVTVLRPWGWFLASFIGFHLLFPAPLRPDLDIQAPSGPSVIATNLRWYPDALAELIGLQRIGDAPIAAFGSPTLGAVWLGAIVVAAIASIFWAALQALRRRPSVDLTLTGALLGIGSIIAMAPYHYQRYLMTVAVLIIVLAASCVARAARFAGRRRPQMRPIASVGAVLVLLAPTFALHLPEVGRSLRFHLTHSYISTGPEDPLTQQLWSAVIEFTDERDVVMFAQPRTMNLYTRRLSVVGNDRNVLMRRADWYAMERDSDYLQVNLSEAEAVSLGLDAVWSNDRYVLWRVLERR